MPTATAVPATSAPAVIVLVATATPSATALARPTPAVRAAATAPPSAEPTARAATPATALAAATAADLAAGPHTVYVVRAGDTLYGIARRYGLSANVLADLNHLSPPYKIIEGHRLLIPAV